MSEKKHLVRQASPSPLRSHYLESRWANSRSPNLPSSGEDTRLGVSPDHHLGADLHQVTLPQGLRLGGTALAWAPPAHRHHCAWAASAIHGHSWWHVWVRQHQCWEVYRNDDSSPSIRVALINIKRVQGHKSRRPHCVALKRAHRLGSCAAAEVGRKAAKVRAGGLQPDVSLGLCVPWLSRVVQCPQPPVFFQLPALGPGEV